MPVDHPLARLIARNKDQVEQPQLFGKANGSIAAAMRDAGQLWPIQMPARFEQCRGKFGNDEHIEGFELVQMPREDRDTAGWDNAAQGRGGDVHDGA